VKFIRFLLILFVFCLMLAFASYGFYQAKLDEPLTVPETGLVLEISKGDTLNKVLRGFVSSGLLESEWVSKVYAKHQKLTGSIKVGEFLLESGATIPVLFELITSNRQIQYQIQFIEGSTYKQLKAVLDAEVQLSHSLKDKSMAEVLQALKLSGDVKHVEGQFYPDTYAFHKGDSDISILKRAHSRLQSILKKEWKARAKDLPLKDAYEALILASIVEKETGAAHERNEIAGVFIRRLEKKMRLQTDPTVIYGLGERYQGNIKRKHLKEMTPYNTYRIKGLPPTPIAIVGQSAIHAALHPDNGKSLYFVAKGDGTHQFSESIRAHNNAVRKFQLKRRAGYRSTQ